MVLSTMWGLCALLWLVLSVGLEPCAGSGGGLLIWRQFISQTNPWPFCSDRAGPVLSLDGSLLYVGSCDYALYTLDSSDGRLVWTFNTSNIIKAGPSLNPDGKQLLLPSQDGR